MAMDESDLSRHALQQAIELAQSLPARLRVVHAARWGADLLIMGTHGRRGFQHLMLGSVAEWTLRRSWVPVLLIPPAKETPTA
ncbi:MAG: universal stress protein [Gammaproteobacteria bacterium]|nr:universal stress protein [Gammaproteobacteria bacterium]MBU4499545.1 universal stress protein [Gammaproteobacteria bacterium]